MGWLASVASAELLPSELVDEELPLRLSRLLTEPELPVRQVHLALEVPQLVHAREDVRPDPAGGLRPSLADLVEELVQVGQGVALGGHLLDRTLPLRGRVHVERA